MKTSIALLLLLAGLLIPASAQLQSYITPAYVILQWTPSPSPTVTNYNVYYGVASRSYTNELSVGFATNAIVLPLIRGLTYYFAVTATAMAGTNTLESSFSNEVNYTLTNIAPVVLTLKGGN